MEERGQASPFVADDAMDASKTLTQRCCMPIVFQFSQRRTARSIGTFGVLFLFRFHYLFLSSTLVSRAAVYLLYMHAVTGSRAREHILCRVYMCTRVYVDPTVSSVFFVQHAHDACTRPFPSIISFSRSHREIEISRTYTDRKCARLVVHRREKKKTKVIERKEA